MALRLAAALALALAALPAGAVAPWDGPPFAAEPRALLAAAEALGAPKGADVDVLLEEGTYRFDARGAATFTHRLVYRPHAPDGARRWARVERSWAPWYQARPEVRGRVVTPDGAVHELDPATLAEQGIGDDGEVFSDRRLLAGPLPGVRPGAVVEEVSTVRDLVPLFDGGVAHRHFLAQPSPVRLSRLTIEAPEALPLRYVVRGADVRPAVKVAGGIRTLVFERRDVAATPQPEPSGPRDVPPGPLVLFGWGRSWADAAERYGALWRARLEEAPLPEPARAAVRGATGDEAIRRALAWVHGHVRYTGLELGEAEIVPAPPATTVKRRYGDCKDLALLLVALLREAGLDARVALLRTAWQDLAPELPGLGQFDHAIVRVEGTPPMWIDPTDPYAPPGTLPPQDEGRLALVTGPGQAELVRTPEAGADANVATTLRELRLAELGPGRIVETRTLAGALAGAERAFRARAPEGREGDLDERYARDVFRADVFLGAEVTGEKELSAPLRVRVEADRSEVVETQDDLAEIPVAPDTVFDPLPRFLRGEAEDGSEEPGEPPRRASDLVLALPYRWETTYRVFPPEGFRVRAPLPAAETERFGPATYARSFAALPDGSVTAVFRFETGGRRIPAADAERLARRVREMVRARSPAVLFERTAAALLAEGRVEAGLAELHRLTALHPREAMHRLHLAIALLRLGFADDAAAEARRGIALEPARAWGERVLAFVLEHDAVGRFHGPGFDRAGALAAYEAARKKDPEHAGGRAALAELLAHDPDGRRFGPGADLARAVAEYRSVHDELGSRDFDDGYLAALFAAGRLGEAVKLARAMPAGAERNAILVAAVAAVDGGARAEAEAGSLGEARRAALTDGAALLYRDRRHPLAAGLAAAAARGAPNAADLFAWAEALAAMRRWEELLDVGDEAERLVRRVIVAAFRGGEASGGIAKLVAPRLERAGLVPHFEARLGIDPSGRRAAARRSSSDVPLDALLSSLHVETTGDPDGGLRVVESFSPAGGADGGALYLAREEGALRLVAADGAFDLLGLEAARRASAGDASGAARWLEWAREAAPGEREDPSSPAGMLGALSPPGATGLDAARRAGLALGAYAGAQGTGVGPLRAARDTVREPAERRALGHALLRALRSQGDAEGALRLADELLAEDPGSSAAFASKAWALRRLRRPAALGEAAEALLAHAPRDAETLGLVGSTYLLAGDLDAAARTFRRAIDAGKASPVVYNDAAWLELFKEPARPLALDWARRAAEQGKSADPAALNTLAAAYAAFGKPAEARDIFLRSLDGGRPLAGADWYVFGRIAEAWGVASAARAAYARTSAQPVDGEEDPSGAHLLARRRLAALGPERSGPVQAAPVAPARGPSRAPAAAERGKPRAKQVH